MKSRDEIKQLAKTPVKATESNAQYVDLKIPLKFQTPDHGEAAAINALKKALSDSIANIHFPESQDYSKMFYAIATAIRGIEMKTENTVEVDIAPLAMAVEANTKAVDRLIGAIKRRRKVIYDGDKVVGVE